MAGLAELEEVFEAALELPARERAAHLAGACRGNADLRRRAERMLEFTEGSGLWIAQSLASVGPEPRRAGPWDLILRLGHGGMGTVYLGLREGEDFLQRAAIKILSENQGPDAVARFRGERAILARLEHQNIARFFDGGYMETGELYLAMEYVEGEPVTAYCATRNLPLKDRVLLFEQICGAVHYAHTNLVIHCDIKPENVLVNSASVPKLLDFGISRLTRPDGLMDRTLTAERRLSPASASPEQIQGRALTTATDIYSLGVLLYRMLTDRLPYTALEDNWQDLALAVTTRQPEPPSRWNPGVKGDLERIILRALHKEPDRRYTSAEQLAGDLERWRNGYPVLAKPDSPTYRVHRFLARHKLGVAAAAVVFVTLLGSSFALYRFARQAQAERDTAQAVAQFTTDVLSARNPQNSRGEEMTATQILNQAVIDIDDRLQGYPDARANVLNEIGKTLRNLGKLKEGEAALLKAIDTLRKAHGDTHPLLAYPLQSLGQLQDMAGRYTEAEQTLRETLRIQRATIGDRDYDATITKNLLGLDLLNQGKYETARVLLEDARRGNPPPPGVDNMQAVMIGGNLSHVYRAQGRLEDAEKSLRDALALAVKMYGKEHSAVTSTAYFLGTLLVQTGRAADAVPLMRETLPVSRKLFPFASGGLATSLAVSAYVLSATGQREEATSLWADALPMRRGIGTLPVNPYLARDLAFYGEHLLRTGDRPGALAAMGESLEIRRKIYGPDDPNVASSHSLLGAVYFSGGDYARAETSFREALRIQQKTQGPENPHTTAGTLGRLGLTLQALGRAAEAEPLIARSAGIRGRLAAAYPYRDPAILPPP